MGKKMKVAILIADVKNLASLKVNVVDLADFMLDQVESTNWIRRAPLVATSR